MLLPLLHLLLGDTPPPPSGLTADDYRLLIEVLLLCIGAAGAFGGVKALTKSNKESIDSVTKTVESELGKMAKKIDEDLARHANEDKAELAKRDSIIQSLTQQNTVQETTLARMSEAHTALTSKHDLLAGEIRNRAAEHDKRIATTESGHAELRADMRALAATVTRIDANVEAVRNAITNPQKRRST